MRRGLIALVLVAGAPLLAQAAVDRNAASTPVQPAAAVWWQAYGDSLLGQLMQRAGADPAAQTAVLQQYMGWRVARQRGDVAARLQEAAGEQRALLVPEGTTPDEAQQRWAEAVAARIAHWAQVQQLMANEEAQAEATLAALTHQARDALQPLLARAHADTELPRVRQALPAWLPTSDATPSTAPLQQLHAAAARAQQAQQLLQASGLELRSRQLRQQAGADSAPAVLEAYQRLLSDTDRWAALNGALALAWAPLLQAGPSLANQG